ncbi:MAG: hypothetical protein WDO69_08525 [Pseudomonadota bacterium]
MSDSKRLILGVNIAAGEAYFALARDDGSLNLSEPVDMSPSNALSGAVQLQEFGSRFVQEVRRLGVSLVGVAHPRPRQRGWGYEDAFARAALEVSMMLVLHDAGIPCRSVAQHKAAKLCGFAEPNTAPQNLKHLTNPKTKYWEKRSVAAMVALALLKES